METTLYTSYSKEQMTKFWKQQRKWNNDSTFNNVNWEAILVAQKSISTQKANWISKHATGNCGVNTTLYRGGSNVKMTIVHDAEPLKPQYMFGNVMGSILMTFGRRAWTG